MIYTGTKYSRAVLCFWLLSSGRCYEVAPIHASVVICYGIHRERISV